MNWRKKHWRSIEQNYRKAPYFSRYADGLRAIYDQKWDRLVDINDAVLRLVMRHFGIETPIEIAGDHDFQGAKSARLLDMCLKLEAKVFLFGALGKGYADEDAFMRRGVVPLFQAYQHPQYDQYGDAEFFARLSAIDLLFFCGPASRQILLRGNMARDDYLSDARERLLNWRRDNLETAHTLGTA